MHLLKRWIPPSDDIKHTLTSNTYKTRHTNVRLYNELENRSTLAHATLGTIHTDDARGRSVNTPTTTDTEQIMDTKFYTSSVYNFESQLVLKTWLKGLPYATEQC